MDTKKYPAKNTDDRIMVVVGKEGKQLLKKLSDEDGRSMSNYCSRIIKDFIDTYKKPVERKNLPV